MKSEFFKKVTNYLDNNNNKVRTLTNIIGIVLMFLAGLFFVFFIDLKVRNVKSFTVTAGVDNINFNVNSKAKKLRDSSDVTIIDFDAATEITINTSKIGGIAVKSFVLTDVDGNTYTYDFTNFSLDENGNQYELDTLVTKNQLTSYFEANGGPVTACTKVTNIFKNGSKYGPYEKGLLIGNTLNMGEMVIVTNKAMKSITVNYQLYAQELKEYNFEVSTWLFFAIIFALGAAIFYFIGDSVKHKHKATIVLKSFGLLFAIGFIAFLFVYLNEVELFYSPSALYPEFIKPTSKSMTEDIYNLNHTIAYISLVFDILGILALGTNFALSIKYLDEDY